MNLQELSLDNIKAEVRDNFRLRLGLWLTLLILLIWVSLVWSDINYDFYKSRRALQQDALTLQDIESADVWAGRLDRASRQLSKSRSRLWSADSEGLARAKLQAELANLVPSGEGGSQVVKVGSAQAVADVESVSRLRARVGVSLTPQAMYELLQNLDRSEHLVVVDQLNMKWVRGNWSVELMISAFFSSEGWRR